jgi:hypothetical protein
MIPTGTKVMADQAKLLFVDGNMHEYTREGSVAKNLAPVQNQKKPSQLGKLITFIRKKMTHKG